MTERERFERAAYVVAMALLQSPAWDHADADTHAAVDLILAREAFTSVVGTLP